jgi:hypothetical protein
MDVLPAHLNIDSFRDSLEGLVALEIVLDLPFSFPINNIISPGSGRIFGDASVTIAQWRRAQDLTNLGYPQVPSSIPAENPSIQINMDLST